MKQVSKIAMLSNKNVVVENILPGVRAVVML